MIDIRVKYFAIFSLLALFASSNCQDLLFDCEFGSGNNCSFIADTSVQAKWLLNTGSTPSRQTGPAQDHTDGTGYYFYAESTDYGPGDIARIYIPKIAGTANTCTTIRFFVHTYGADIGTLNYYILGNEPYYFGNPFATRQGQNVNEWIEQEVTIQVSFDYSIGFEAIFSGSLVTDNRGDMAIDDITVTTNSSCALSSCADQGAVCLNGGICIATNNVGEDFDYKCECAPGWSGDHCENDLDECSPNPCNNGTCYHGLDTFSCTCDEDFYGENCEFDRRDLIFSCEFEDDDNCGFQNDTSATAKWILNSGPTPSTITGPQQDHTDGTGVSTRPILDKVYVYYLY